jgi:hypothetical protein
LRSATSTRRASPRPCASPSSTRWSRPFLPGSRRRSAKAACASPAASANASASPARSIHDPDVLLLDEATAALDHPTEAALGDALRALRGDRTVLLVAHRLSTVRGCDRIALVIGGRLVDCGTFDELLARSAEFRRLAAGGDAGEAMADAATQRARGR